MNTSFDYLSGLDYNITEKLELQIGEDLPVRTTKLDALVSQQDKESKCVLNQLRFQS